MPTSESVLNFEKEMSAAANNPTRPSVLAPGDVLQNRYRIVRELGKGGMGAVYEAIDQRLDATVALKETFSIGERLRTQFAQEARLLAQLHHPALPRVSDYFTEGDRVFLVMQFIAGIDLSEIIARQPGPFPRSQVIAWADQLLDALIYLHTRNRQIIHRDIKPHNLKLTTNGRIALLDFGLAKTQSADLSASTSSVSIFGYTRRYSPLEQIRDEGTTPQSDIYALGATLYHLLTGVKPPDALARAAALVHSKPDPLVPANEIHPAVGPEIAAILSRAMAQGPKDRYVTANEFREALGQVGRSEARSLRNPTQSLTVSVSDSTINTTVVRKAPPVDPFDGYSILKPNDTAWLIPKRSRFPGVVATILAILVAVGLAAFSGFGRWIDSADSLWNYAAAKPSKDPSTASAENQSKADSAHPKISASKNVSAVSLETSRKNDNQPDRPKPLAKANSRATEPLPLRAVSTQAKSRNANAGSIRNRRVTPINIRE